MLSLGAVFLVSVLLGMRHAAEPDHVVAVSTIVSRERSAWRASAVGALWGLGHTLTLVAAGVAIVGFELTVTARVGLSLELGVAAMLIVLGALNLTHARGAPPRVSHARPFVVGAVHGLAGSAAALLLVLPLITDPRWAVLYLAALGAGTVLGMSLITLAIAGPAALAMRRMTALHGWIPRASGALSVAFGLYLGYRIGFVDGLFTGAPRWVPR
jgi:hypothetical protein